MRIVAVALALFFLATAMPAATASDDCYTNAAEPRACVPIPLPSPHPTVAAKTFYAHFGGPACKTLPAGPLSRDCTGTPASGGATLGVFGILYEETNGLQGLQRFSTSVGTVRNGDRILLV